MNAREFRANAAGYLDSATTLVRVVVETFKDGAEMRDETGKRQKVDVPPAVYQELLEAERHIQRVAAWLLDDSFNL